MKRLYAVLLVLQKVDTSKVAVTCRVDMFETMDLARARAVCAAAEEFPESQGWECARDNIDIQLVPDADIITAYRELEAAGLVPPPVDT